MLGVGAILILQQRVLNLIPLPICQGQYRHRTGGPRRITQASEVGNNLHHDRGSIRTQDTLVTDGPKTHFSPPQISLSNRSEEEINALCSRRMRLISCIAWSWTMLWSTRLAYGVALSCDTTPRLWYHRSALVGQEKKSGSELACQPTHATIIEGKYRNMPHDDSSLN